MTQTRAAVIALVFPCLFAVELRAQDARLQRALNKQTVFEFKDVPLDIALRKIGDLSKVKISIDKKSLDDAVISLDSVVNITARNMSLGAALRHMLRDVDLTWTRASGQIWVEHRADAVGREQSYVYPVVDLTHRDRTSASADYDTLIDVLTSCITPDSWPAESGSGPFDIFDGSLVLRTDGELDARVRATLEAMRLAKKSLGAAPIIVPQRNQRAWDRLLEPSKFTLDEMPSEAALAQLSDRIRIPILVDRRLFDNEAQVLPLKVAIKPAETLEAALIQTLGDVRVSVDEEAIMILPNVSAAFGNEWHTIVWPIEDLLDEKDAFGHGLVNLLTHQLADDNISIGIGWFPQKPLLLSYAPRAFQLRIQRLLGQLRKAKATTDLAVRQLPVVDPWQTVVYALAAHNTNPPGAPASAIGGLGLGRRTRGTLDAERVVEVLRKLVAEVSDKEAVIEPLNGRIVVRNKRSVHEKVAILIRQMNVPSK